MYIVQYILSHSTQYSPPYHHHYNTMATPKVFSSVYCGHGQGCTGTWRRRLGEYNDCTVVLYSPDFLILYWIFVLCCSLILYCTLVLVQSGMMCRIWVWDCDGYSTRQERDLEVNSLVWFGRIHGGDFGFLRWNCHSKAMKIIYQDLMIWFRHKIWWHVI